MAEERAWEEIKRRLEDGLTGDITLHVTQGRVTRYEVREVKRVTVDRTEPLPVDLHT